MHDFTILLPNRPGVPANLFHQLEKAGIKIQGISGTQYHDKVVMHLLFGEDAAEAQALLFKNKFTITSIREVLVTPIKDKPDQLGKIARSLANAEIKINFVYLATNNRIVLGVDDLENAREAL